MASPGRGRGAAGLGSARRSARHRRASGGRGGRARPHAAHLPNGGVERRLDLGVGQPLGDLDGGVDLQRALELLDRRIPLFQPADQHDGQVDVGLRLERVAVEPLGRAQLQRLHQRLARFLKIQVLVGVDRPLVEVPNLGQGVRSLRQRAGRHTEQTPNRMAADRVSTLEHVRFMGRNSCSKFYSSGNERSNPMPSLRHPLQETTPAGSRLVAAAAQALYFESRCVKARALATRGADGPRRPARLDRGVSHPRRSSRGSADGARVPTRTTSRRPRRATSICWSISGTTSRRETLAATPWQEEALSDYSAQDGLYRIRFDAADDARRAAQALRANAAVESVDWDVPATLPPDEMMAAQAGPPGLCVRQRLAPTSCTRGFPDDPCFKYQWHMRQVGLPERLEAGPGRGRGGRGHRHRRHPGARPDGRPSSSPGFNFVANNANAADDHGHGTHVAGTIAQATNNRLGVAGVAFGAKIMPLKVLSAQGSGSMGAIAQAIRYAADHGAKVINMSLGGPFPVGAIRTRGQIRPRQGRGGGRRRRQRRPRPGELPRPLPGGLRGRRHPVRREHHLLFELGHGDRHRRAGRKHASVDQNGDGKPDGVLQNTVVPGQHQQDRLPVVHGDLDGLAPRRRRRGAGGGRGGEQARRGRGPAARHRPQAQGGQRDGRGAAGSTTTTAPASSTPGAALRKSRDVQGRRWAGPGRGPGAAGPGGAAPARSARPAWAGRRRRRSCWAPAACSSCPCSSSPALARSPSSGSSVTEAIPATFAGVGLGQPAAAERGPAPGGRWPCCRRAAAAAGPGWPGLRRGRRPGRPGRHGVAGRRASCPTPSTALWLVAQRRPSACCSAAAVLRK